MVGVWSAVSTCGQTVSDGEQGAGAGMIVNVGDVEGAGIQEVSSVSIAKGTAPVAPIAWMVGPICRISYEGGQRDTGF